MGDLETDWDEKLPHITRSMNAMPNRVTGESANYLMYGREF